jgi:hypothetical protein
MRRVHEPFGIRGNPQFLRRRDGLHGADEAGSIAGCKQLFRAVARAAGAAEFLRQRQLNVQAAVGFGLHGPNNQRNCQQSD